MIHEGDAPSKGTPGMSDATTTGYRHRHTGGAATYHLVVQVQGLPIARTVARIMEEETGRPTPHDIRGEATGAIYWVSNTYLEPTGEQRVLEYLADRPGRLLYVAGASHRRHSHPVSTGPRRSPLDDRTRKRLRAIASGFAALPPREPPDP
jgi:hypothetical protein